MSISPLSSALYSTPSFDKGQNNRKQDFNQLSTSLQSGDLAGAQKAYAQLQQLQSGSQSGPNSTSNSTSPIAADFEALGKALSSGDLTQSQSAFAQLKTDLTSAQPNAGSQGGTPATHKHGHHHHPETGTDGGPSTAIEPGGGGAPAPVLLSSGNLSDPSTPANTVNLLA